MDIINLTQHAATAEQIAAGVVDLPPEKRAALVRALTFEEIPDRDVLWNRAIEIALMAEGYRQAMIGGAPFFMPMLDEILRKDWVRPLYAFSKRESAEMVMPDGSTRKVAVFRHVGFVEW